MGQIGSENLRKPMKKQIKVVNDVTKIKRPVSNGNLSLLWDLGTFLPLHNLAPFLYTDFFNLAPNFWTYFTLIKH